MTNTRYIQIGVAARRTAAGDFMPSVPILAETSEPILAETSEPINKSGLHESEEGVLHDLSALFAAKHLQIKEANDVKI